MHNRVSEQDIVRYRISGYDQSELTHTETRDWGGCRRCKLAITRNRVALKRRGGTGRIRLMFVGEAPGQFEDVMGVPFIGPAGHILNQLISFVPHQFSYLITNIVCCRPMDLMFLDEKYDAALEEEDRLSLQRDTLSFPSKDSQPSLPVLKDLTYGEDYEIHDMNRKPTPPEIKACSPHLLELYNDYKPHGVVFLGATANENYNPPGPTLALFHPAYISRLEYKLIPVLKEADKLERFVERLAASND